MTDKNDDNKVLISSTDKELLKVAKSESTDFVTLTPDLLDQMKKGLDARIKEINELYPRLIDACPSELRLAVTAQVFKAIVDHATEGGTFRYLIYDRLGFGPEAYVPLYEAGGMTISNEFNLPSTIEHDWTPASTVPAEGQPVDVWCIPDLGTGGRIADCWYINGEWRSPDRHAPEGWSQIYNVTHWRRVPNPPGV